MSGFFKEISKNKFLYLLTVPGIIFLILFAYMPIGGLVIAFQNFSFTKGILKSPFVGMNNFTFLFSSGDVWRVTLNTLYLNSLFIIYGMIFSVTTAITLSEIRSKTFTKLGQTVVILPNFLSWTVVALISTGLLSSDMGLINMLLKAINKQPIEFYANPNVWPTVLVITNVWKNAGFNSIIYTAAIAGIDQEIYEAAKIEGAGRFGQIWHITLPMLKNTAILLLLMSIGRIFYGDFGMIYAFVRDNALLFPTTDVIDTFTYRALRQLPNLGMSSAVGLYQSSVGFVIVLIANAVARKVSPDSALF